ncbi:hypothetical protein [Streptomyces sp. RTd22]|uniref:hypothetical protein n=1 Tax=Streptomyces sp. RTd22 TaxID=1841249 RepID=UPI0007C46958|nr:hypothetical protein [Streptomyces sp. RTd22]
MSIRKVLVSADDVHAYEAMVDTEAPLWNGFLSPRFTLEAVKQIASDMQEDLKRSGYADQEEIRVIEAPGLFGESEDRVDEFGEPIQIPAVVVLHISWTYVFDDDPESCAKVVAPGKDGLYAVGAWEWTWSEISPNISQRAEYLFDFATAAINEAVWYEVEPTEDDEDQTLGMEWEAVEALNLGINSVHLNMRSAFMSALGEFIDANAQVLNGIPADQAGYAFWHSMRGVDGIKSRSFLGRREIPAEVRQRLHETARTHSYSSVRFVGDMLHIES